MPKKLLTGNVKNLTLSYGSHTVLKNVSFDFHLGDLTFLVGASGCGKTSLFYTFNRLSESFPLLKTQGQIDLLIDQKWESIYPHSSLPITDLRCKVAMVFQTPHLLPGSIRNNFLLPLKLVKKLPKNVCEELMEKHLKEVCLWDDVKTRLDKPASQLSIGQQQRICLARSLAMQPNFLFLDEPTASLDSTSAQEILTLLRSLRERYTIVLVSHNEREWEQYADRVWLVKDANIVELS